MSNIATHEPLLIDSKELARLLSLSPRWVEANRQRIVGAQKVGGRWRFNYQIISRAVATGKNIIFKKRT